MARPKEFDEAAVLDEAVDTFWEHGFDGIGLKDLMKGAGLTQGAFYKQFASKEDLAAHASRRALESAFSRWSAATAANPKDPLGAVMAFYLSVEHREERMDGCPIVALGSDAARQGSDAKALFEAGIKAHLHEFAARGLISKYGVPERVIFVKTLPKTSVGKLDKKLLRAQCADNQGDQP